MKIKKEDFAENLLFKGMMLLAIKVNQTCQKNKVHFMES